MNASQITASNALHHTASRTRRVFPTMATAALVVALGSLPAAARQDPGPIVPDPQTTATYFCTLQRVGTQFVACDNLTGNGMPAPVWVDER